MYLLFHVNFRYQIKNYSADLDSKYSQAPQRFIDAESFQYNFQKNYRL